MRQSTKKETDSRTAKIGRWQLSEVSIDCNVVLAKKQKGTDRKSPVYESILLSVPLSLDKERGVPFSTK